MKAKQGGFRDPMVDFYQPFQSGEGLCKPIFPWNYYNSKGGKAKNQKVLDLVFLLPESPYGKLLSQWYGVVEMLPKSRKLYKWLDCGNVKNVPMATRKYFGPFAYPPTPYPMNPNCKGGKKNKKGGTSLVGKNYLTQPLVPNTPSKPSDLQYNGSFSENQSSDWKTAFNWSRCKGS